MVVNFPLLYTLIVAAGILDKILNKVDLDGTAKFFSFRYFSSCFTSSVFVWSLMMRAMRRNFFERGSMILKVP